MRTTISRSSWILAIAAGASLAPVAMRAQATTDSTRTPAPGGTHVVKTGDTLWDLARRYLNDPFLWPEIYRLNTAVVEDPHWIYPGERLRLPGDAPAPIATTAGEPAGPTVFDRVAAPATASAGPRAIRGPHAAVRAGEYLSAPYVDRVGGPDGAGKIIGVADVAGVSELDPQFRFQPSDRLYVTLPKAAAQALGERFLAYSLGPVLPSGGQVVVPTGVVEIEHVGRDQASTVRLVQSFGSVTVAQGLIPMDGARVFSTASAAAIDGGPEARVLFVEGDHVLPSLQQFLVLSAHNGVKAGDQFTLYRAAHSGDFGESLPDEVVGVAQVLRVTEFGSSAVVVHQSQPAIALDMPARLTARMP